MNRNILIQNIIRACATKGEPPTNACFNAGVGKSFISDIKRGQTPSVAKVAELAAYLGVTTSDLVGDNVSNLDTKKLPEESQIPEAAEKLIELFSQLNEEGGEKLLEYADDLVSSGKYKKHRAIGMDKEA